MADGGSVAHGHPKKQISLSPIGKDGDKTKRERDGEEEGINALGMAPDGFSS